MSDLADLIGKDAMNLVLRRLAGEPHRHHRDCIHNLSPDEQIELQGRTREWWEAMGLSEPVQITPDDWDLAYLEGPK